MTPTTQTSALEALEIELLLEGIHRHYGLDFRGYAYPSLRRRILNRVSSEKLDTISALTNRVLHDPECMQRLLFGLTVNVTSMFRDTAFYKVFRSKVVPLLRTYPFIRIWHAGCATGEEVYSLAILLTEDALYDRCRIYATDIDEVVIQQAKTGIFPLGAMRDYTANYIRAGGTGSFSSYYSANYDNAVLRSSLKTNLVFSTHNLVSDARFNDFHVILCRNVMIYFDKALQDRVHALFHESLLRLGFLGLGKRESMRFTPHEDRYEAVDAAEKLFRKVA